MKKTANKTTKPTASKILAIVLAVLMVTGAAATTIMMIADALIH